MTDWIPTDEAMRPTGYNAEYLRRLIRQGKVKAQKFGAVWQISRSSLLAYRENAQSTEDKRRGPRDKE